MATRRNAEPVDLHVCARDSRQPLAEGWRADGQLEVGVVARDMPGYSVQHRIDCALDRADEMDSCLPPPWGGEFTCSRAIFRGSDAFGLSEVVGDLMPAASRLERNGHPAGHLVPTDLLKREATRRVRPGPCRIAPHVRAVESDIQDPAGNAEADDRGDFMTVLAGDLDGVRVDLAPGLPGRPRFAGPDVAGESAEDEQARLTRR
jgi:hypothetical protein